MLFKLLPIFLVVLESSQSWALSVPTPRSMGFSTFGSDSVASACTTNISLPTASEKCISSCRPFQEAQLLCRDYSHCMCQLASTTDLQSCIACIIDNAGGFAHVFQKYIDMIKTQVANYAAACDAIKSPAPNTAATISANNDLLYHVDSCSQLAMANVTSPSLPIFWRPEKRTSPPLFLLLTLISSLVLMLIACLRPWFGRNTGMA